MINAFFKITLKNQEVKILKIGEVTNFEKSDNSVSFESWLQVSLLDFFGEEFSYFNILKVQKADFTNTPTLFIEKIDFETKVIEDLQELMDVIQNTFKCDENVYWKLKYLPKEKWDYEIISHSSRHLSKSAGKLASVCESYEHGAPFDVEQAKDSTMSALATILKNASMLGMTAQDLFEKVPEKIQYKKK